MKQMTRQLMNKAENAIEAAELLLKGEKPEFAAGRAYYAMFYVAEALLFEQGLSFLLRELEILHNSNEYQSTPARFFALHLDKQGVQVQQGVSMDDLDPIAALDEELSQSDRFLELDS